jgi:hypothetical protein
VAVVATFDARLLEVVARRVCREVRVGNDQWTEHQVDAWCKSVRNRQVEPCRHVLRGWNRRIEVDNDLRRVREIDRCDESRRHERGEERIAVAVYARRHDLFAPGSAQRGDDFMNGRVRRRGVREVQSADETKSNERCHAESSFDHKSSLRLVEQLQECDDVRLVLWSQNNRPAGHETEELRIMCRHILECLSGVVMEVRRGPPNAPV